jgi:hypothetical protein
VSDGYADLLWQRVLIARADPNSVTTPCRREGGKLVPIPIDLGIAIKAEIELERLYGIKIREMTSAAIHELRRRSK